MGGWGDSATKRAQRLRQRAADMAGSAEHADRASSEHEGDVYIIDDEGPGVWDVEHVLDASYDNSSLSEAHTLSIEVCTLEVLPPPCAFDVRLLTSLSLCTGQVLSIFATEVWK